MQLGSGDRMRIKLLQDPWFDVLVVQRTMVGTWPAALAAFREAGVRIVLDLDDDLWSMSGRHHGFHGVQPKMSPDHNHQHLSAAMRHADLVTVTTPALAERCSKWAERVEIIPNAVPSAYLTIEAWKEPGLLQLGWPGWAATHPGDLRVVGPGVARAMRRHPEWVFRVIGVLAGVKRELGLDIEPECNGPVPLTGYARAIASLDVGIAPLQQSAFNEAKSPLKPLEFASVGVPFVCSPTSPYREFVESTGVGFLASSPKEWERLLRALFASPTLRAEQAAAGRQVVADRYTIEGNVDRWRQAWLGLTPVRDTVGNLTTEGA